MREPSYDSRRGCSDDAVVPHESPAREGRGEGGTGILYGSRCLFELEAVADGGIGPPRGLLRFQSDSKGRARFVEAGLCFGGFLPVFGSGQPSQDLAPRNCHAGIRREVAERAVQKGGDPGASERPDPRVGRPGGPYDACRGFGGARRGPPWRAGP